ncbi:hypothetical protein OAE97_00865 [Verrucomicrobia bacterium]|jgi:hypothetical protein|nr:hypothetical protein [Verrucomicrobiota bacterium]
MIQFYKPNPKVTGHACSFNYSDRDRCVYVNLIKQASWDDSKKRGTFGQNAKNPAKSCNFKLSDDEMCGIINTIRSNAEFKIFHSNPNQKTMGSFSPYMRQETQMGFGLSINKQPTNGEKSSFLVGFNFGEAIKLEAFFTFCLTKIFQALDKEQEAWRSKGSSNQPAPKANSAPPKPPTPPKEEPVFDSDEEW